MFPCWSQQRGQPAAHVAGRGGRVVRRDTRQADLLHPRPAAKYCGLN